MRHPISKTLVTIRTQNADCIMRSLNTTSYSAPSGYQVSDLPAPKISDPRDVLIKVHAASINPIDVKKASGMLKMALNDE